MFSVPGTKIGMLNTGWHRAALWYHLQFLTIAKIMFFFMCNKLN